MTEDMYLSLAIELFEKGTWSKDLFIKRITLYAKEKNIDMSIIDEIIDRLINTKENTIEEKRKFLSFVTIADNELKYGDVVYEMSDEMVEKFYKMEKDSLEKKEEVQNVEFTNNELVSEKKEEVSKVSSKIETPNIEEIKKYWNKETETFNSYKENNEEIEVIGNTAFEIPVETKEIVEEVFTWNKSIKDIINGNYTSKDLLGNSESEKDKIFNYLIENVKVDELREVANSLINKMEPSYCLNFTIEWEKYHKDDLKDVEEKDTKEEVIEEYKENNETSKSIDIETKEDEVLEIDEEKQPILIIPKLSFDSYGEDDLPTTEEEYQTQADNLTKTEKDSIVRKVNISPERLAKLKKTKDRAVNCTLKTAMMILAFKLAGPFIGIGAVASYLYFAEEIKCGTFNPKNPVGKAIKYTVEKVMNIGIKKENERGKAK